MGMAHCTIVSVPLNVSTSGSGRKDAISELLHREAPPQHSQAILSAAQGKQSRGLFLELVDVSPNDGEDVVFGYSRRG